MGQYREKLLTAGRRDAGGPAGQRKMHALVPAKSIEDGALVDKSFRSLPEPQDRSASGVMITEQVVSGSDRFTLPPLFTHMGLFFSLNQWQLP